MEEEMIEASIILDSIGRNEAAPRLTTWMLTLPRNVLAELNTHRAFSRNAASSRAVPVMKKLRAVLADPFIPHFWGLNQKGMQAYKEATGLRRSLARAVWGCACLSAVAFAWVLHKLGLHKQIVNRLVEPFSYVTVLLTSTQKGLENFFTLRIHKDAEPHMRILAKKMLDLYNASVPQMLNPGEWHIPFMESSAGIGHDIGIKVAVARAARLSYEDFDGEIDLDKDVRLHNALMEDGHWSPFEHIAQVPEKDDYETSNLLGWSQLRKKYPNECRTCYRVINR
jgi:thymidylate synthase ThyX